MNPTIATPITFTDEEAIDKPRIGINYEGNKLYAPIGLGWYGEKKGLYSGIYNSHSKAIFGLNNKKETTETATLYIEDGLFKLTKDLKYDFKVYVTNTLSWANGRGTLLLTAREAVEQEIELTVGSRVTFWYDDGYAGYFDVDGEPKKFTITEFDDIRFSYESGPVTEWYNNSYAYAYKGISPINLPFGLNNDNKGLQIKPDSIHYDTTMSLTEGGVFESVLKVYAWTSELTNRSVSDAFALNGGGVGDGEFSATIRLYCPFTGTYLGMPVNYGFHYNDPGFGEGEKITPILESNLVRASVPFALVELA